MDALPPDATKAHGDVRLGSLVAPTDLHPRPDEERDLCSRASHPDWLYLGGLVALDVDAILLHPTLKQEDSQAVRALGPGLLGLTWGATLGGAVLSRPTCDPNFVWSAPPDGDVRSSWPLATALALVSAATAPLLVGIVTGPLSTQWEYPERSSRLWISAGAGAIGSLLPRIPWIAPAPHRAGLELERLRLEPQKSGATATVTWRF